MHAIFLSALLLGVTVPPGARAASPYVIPNLYVLDVRFLKAGENLRPGRNAELFVQRCLTGQKWVQGKSFFYNVLMPAGELDSQAGKNGLFWLFIRDIGDRDPYIDDAIMREFHLNSFPIRQQDFEWWKDRMDYFQSGTELRKQPGWEEICRIEYLSYLLDWEAWYTAFADVYALPDPQHQRAVLERVAKSARLPEIRSWAMVLLSKGPKEHAVEFLRQFELDPKLPFDCQVALDEIFCKIDPDRWLKSKPRMDMMKRWVKIQDNLEFVYGLGYDRAVRAFNEGHLEFEVLMDLSAEGYRLIEQGKRGSHTTDYYKHLLNSVARIKFPAKYRAVGFDFIMNKIEHSKYEPLPVDATIGLSRFAPLTEHEKLRVHRVQETHANKVVRDQLQEILAKEKPYDEE